MSDRVRRLVPAQQPRVLAVRGCVVGWEPERGIWVQVEGDEARVLAQSVIELSEAELDRAVGDRRAVTLIFEDGNRTRPVILGFLARTPARARQEQAPSGPIEQEVVLIRGRDSVQLRCGAASICLYKDGKIVVRGTNVISRATEQNRISGGSVHFN